MLEIKTCGDSVLREKCVPVKEISQDILRAMTEMAEIMEQRQGVGLAAPQVGILQRFLVMKEVKNMRDPGILRKMINPEILSKSEKTCVWEEGCLSVMGPGDVLLFADVARSENVTVRWTDEHGRPQTREFSGLPARIVQHEIDHLDGILFLDYLSSTKREMMIRKIKKRKN